MKWTEIEKKNKTASEIKKEKEINIVYSVSNCIQTPFLTAYRVSSFNKLK